MNNLYQTSKSYLYIVKCEGAYKIGISALPEQRISLIKTDNHKPVEVIGVFKLGNANKWEQDIHEVLKEEQYHIRGEWFSCSREQINQLIKVLKES